MPIGFSYSDTYRYKMTVEVNTPEGVRTGSAVREITARDNTGQIRGGMRGLCGFDAKGEAVVVDLGARGGVFAVMTQGGSSDYVWNVLFRTLPRTDKKGGECLKEGIRYYANLEAKGEVPLRALPMMVTFADRSDPTSVQYVYGVEAYGRKMPDDWRVKEDNFEKLFGKGVSLRRVTIEMTDEPVTEGNIEKTLGWFQRPNLGKQLGLKFYNPTKPGPENYLTNFDFKRRYIHHGH